MPFPKRFAACAHPEYPDAVFRILANPPGALYDALLMGTTATDEDAAKLGAAMQEAYGGATVEAYGVVFDFSTPAAAVTTLQHEATPVDLRAWLRSAPIDLVVYEREELGKNFRASLTPGS